MLDDQRWQDFVRRFPTLGADGKLASELKRSVLYRDVPADSVLYRDGDECTHLPLVLSGELLLTKYGETGRAITLYRVETGQSCILSTLSILNASEFPAEASTHSQVSLVLVPAAMLRRLVSESDEWRDYIFSMYHARLATLIQLIEEVVFGKLDVRLARAVLRHAGPGSDPIRATHQELAVELGSSREVVSRLLKEWERRGVVSLSRGSVVLQRAADLQGIADQGD
jgi:CRP/FNR family transcriptional regulator